MYLHWGDGHHTLAEIAKHFHVKYTAVCQARTRAETVLAKDGRLQGMSRRVVDGETGADDTV